MSNNPPNTVIDNAKLGIGPMSKEVVDAIVDFAKENATPVMLIASRNQVDCEELGGGYAENWTTQEFADYVKKTDCENILLCRDHCGPYFRAEEKGLSLADAIDSTKKTIVADLKAGFDLIHIDSCHCPGEELNVAKELVDFTKAMAAELDRSILFEVGTDENTGYPPKPADFERDLKLILDFVDPQFVVGQTGSLTKECFQVGYFNFDEVKQLCEIAKAYDVRFKEHNCDYVERMELGLRSTAGVGAVNVAPEFGVLQTRVVTTLADKFGCRSELKKFREVVLESEKWAKWIYGTETHNNIKYLSAGHYCFTSDAYKNLVNALSKHVDVGAAIHSHVKSLVGHYVGELS